MEWQNPRHNVQREYYVRSLSFMQLPSDVVDLIIGYANNGARKGQLIDARDTLLHEWRVAVVLEEEKNGEILVHYCGWSSQIIGNLSFERLAPLHTHTQGKIDMSFPGESHDWTPSLVKAVQTHLVKMLP